MFSIRSLACSKMGHSSKSFPPKKFDEVNRVYCCLEVIFKRLQINRSFEWWNKVNIWPYIFQPTVKCQANRITVELYSTRRWADIIIESKWNLHSWKRVYAKLPLQMSSRHASRFDNLKPLDNNASLAMNTNNSEHERLTQNHTCESQSLIFYHSQLQFVLRTHLIHQIILVFS